MTATECVREINATELEDGDADCVCAICFEQQPFLELPCSCRANYCASCWDRALRASVRDRGQAQCPSCRSNFCVDFDQDTAGLVFSKTDEGMTRQDWRSRLYDKARPVQISLLQDYGATARSSTAPSAEGVLVASSEGILAPSAPSVTKGKDAHLDEAQDDLCQPCGPLCVCGGVFERVDAHSRIRRMLEDTQPGWSSRIAQQEQLVDKLASSNIITCDLCDDVALTTGFLWTCKKGPNTVLHPAAYDICEFCFSRHAGLSTLAAI
mmetsp:Transcript_78232/g.135698  ORF Transcript_78232/g.135698 Transcript_78232/m.135698 type:complete len:267 (-) Transcript_78232:36-836(-)